MNRYEMVKKLGFDIEIKFQREGISRMYLMKDSERTGGFVSFYDNRLTTSRMLEKVRSGDYLPNTYLDIATNKLVELAMETSKAKKEKNVTVKFRP